MTVAPIHLKLSNFIAAITVDNPPVNAWDLSTIKAFEKAVEDVAANPEARVLVITGAGDRCFSAGSDLKDAGNASRIGECCRDVWRRIHRFPKPVIAAINGHALGGGLELALSCHFRIMMDSERPKVGLTELNLGLIPNWGGTQRLTQLVGRSRALDMILFSRTVGAREALQTGLVDRIAPAEKFDAAVMEMAERLAERPPIAVRCVLEAFCAGIHDGLDAGLAKEAEGAAVVRKTEDSIEGIAAFLEKRKPVFKGW